MAVQRPANRPGLGTLAYRIGTFDTFREAMLARLSGKVPEMTTRTPGDPFVAMIDAWACVGDVLTFYQERLANEGYLRTALERRSILELARLIGHRPNAGVAASVALAYTLDKDSRTRLPAGSRVQNVPPQGATPQFFETSDALDADGAWNAMKPRRTRPAQAAEIAAGLDEISVAGTATGLKDNDPILLVVGGKPELHHVSRVEPQFDRERTRLVLRAARARRRGGDNGERRTADDIVTQQVQLFTEKLNMPPAGHPRTAAGLVRSPELLFAAQTETALALRGNGSPGHIGSVFRALANETPIEEPDVQLFMFRSHVAPFGSSAPQQLVLSDTGRVQTSEEWTIQHPVFGPRKPVGIQISFRVSDETSRRAFMDRLVEFSRSDGFDFPIHITSAINFGGRVSLDLEPRRAATASADLGADDAVTVTLTEIAADQDHFVLTYVFKKSGLTLVVDSARQSTSAARRGEMKGRLSLDPVVVGPNGSTIDVSGAFQPATGTASSESADTLYLDGALGGIGPDSWIAFEAPPMVGSPVPPAVRVARADIVSRVAYGQTSKATRVALAPGDEWIDPERDGFERIRTLRVHADSVELALVDTDISTEVPLPEDKTRVELDGLYPGLKSGRWAIVEGERTDLPKVRAAELVMIAAAEHGLAVMQAPDGRKLATPLPGEHVHTTLTFSSPLGYTYRRDTVTIYGNVAQTTQGQAVAEVLGSGRGNTGGQSFTLKKPPLTYVASATATGNASTLVVRVNGQRWHEVDDFTGSGPDDRVFVTETAEDDAVTVRFGDGIRGARLPTGSENVEARYRSGIGPDGNAEAGTITTLMSRPLGVKGVTNPLAATGGAARDTEEELRRNAPLGLNALDRLVSARDYADFALDFAGVAKATAVEFNGPTGPLVHVTLAAPGNRPLPPDGALHAVLLDAFRKYGDTAVAVMADAAAALLLFLRVRIRVDPDYEWVEVEPRLRDALLKRFGFDSRDLGKPLYRSEVVAAAQKVRGVDAVELKTMTAVAPDDAGALARIAATSAVEDIFARAAAFAPRRAGTSKRIIHPAELVFLSGDLTDLLLLEEAAQ